MNKNRTKTLLLAIVLLVIPLAILFYIRSGSLEKTSTGTALDQRSAAPIEVAPIEYGPIEWRRDLEDGCWV